MSAEALSNPVETFYKAWKAQMKTVIAEKNISADTASTAASTPYARMFLMQNPTSDTDLEGNECATDLTFQVEIFTSGNKALDKAYAYDDVSHKTMISLGFRRTYGASLIDNADSNVKRLVSRYSMLYTG